MLLNPANNLLIVFVKYPLPGYVKSRLAKSIGKQKAAFIYRKIAERVIKDTESSNYRQEVFFSPSDRRKEFRQWLGDLYFYPQKGENLGERMYNAFVSGFARGYQHIVLIGSDTPGINCKLIKKAFSILTHKEVVIGPSFDGGYYLIGLKSPIKYIFSHIKWSTDYVLEETIERLREKKLSFSLLERKIDIDDKESMEVIERYGII